MKYDFLISAGHSVTDPGAVANGLREADVAVKVRDQVAAKLRARGYTVVTDNGLTTNDDLKVAIKLISSAKVSIELHCNAAEAATARGVESISLPQFKKLSQQISYHIANALQTKLRGEAGWIDQSQSARGRLGFVNNGGIIVEMFFLTNAAEVAKFKESSGELIADAIVNALIVGAR